MGENENKATVEYMVQRFETERVRIEAERGDAAEQKLSTMRSWCRKAMGALAAPRRHFMACASQACDGTPCDCGTDQAIAADRAVLSEGKEMGLDHE